nr:hypothetical protein CFP56_47750 [Quercus suber]
MTITGQVERALMDDRSVRLKLMEEWQWMEGGRSSTNLSEGEKDSAGIKPNLAGSMPNVVGSETNTVGFEQIYAKHRRILANLSQTSPDLSGSK